MGLVHRQTMFKVPEPEDQQKLRDAFEVLAREQSKDGEPYILNIRSRVLLADTRSLDYTVLVHMTFASREDMQYFDQRCPAHMKLKEKVQRLMSGRPLVVAAELKET